LNNSERDTEEAPLRHHWALSESTNLHL